MRYSNPESIDYLRDETAKNGLQNFRKKIEKNEKNEKIDFFEFFSDFNSKFTKNQAIYK